MSPEVQRAIDNLKSILDTKPESPLDNRLAQVSAVDISFKTDQVDVIAGLLSRYVDHKTVDVTLTKDEGRSYLVKLVASKE